MWLGMHELEPYPRIYVDFSLEVATWTHVDEGGLNVA